MAAARHVLILCGSTEIDGYAFSSGLESLRDFYGARLDLQNLIQPVTYLIREAIFRPKYVLSRSGKVSLDICPLGALIDMYHTHEATNRHDKIYALLGMSSDDLSAAGLSPDYQVSWKELLQRLVKFLLGKQVSVKTWNNREMAIIDSRGYILSQVSSVKSDQGNRQNVNISFKNTSQHLGYTKEYKAHWNLQASAKSIQKGDIVCLLQGASKPTIIRPYKDHFAIIMIAATFPEAIEMESDSDRWPDLRDFPLIWNWEKALDRLQDQEEYNSLMEANRQVPECSQKKKEDYVRKAMRLYSIALILEDLREYKEAGKRLQEGIEVYKRALGKEHLHTLGLMDKLAIIYKKTQQWKEAEELLLQVIQIRKCVQGEEHSDTFYTLANLVLIYRDQGYLKGIEELGVITDLLKPKEHAAQITEKEVVKIIQSPKEIMALLLDRRGGDVPITKAVVQAAIRNWTSGKEIITALLNRIGGDVLITEAVVRAAARNWEMGGREIIIVLLDRGGGDVLVAEAMVQAAARNRTSGKEIMTLLLDRRGDDVPITEAVVQTVAWNGTSGKEIMTLLLDRRGGDVPITEAVVQAAVGNRTSGKEIITLLLDRRGGDVPITEAKRWFRQR